MSDLPAIEHDTTLQEFRIDLPEEAAVLSYLIDHAPAGEPGSKVVFTHTYVPSIHRGQGHAERLVRHGLAWARGEQHQVSATCWYAQRFLR